MRNPRQMRGEPERQLDPLLERAVARLAQHMTEKGLSQQQLAKDSGVDQGRISKLLSRQVPEVSFYVMVRVLHGAGLTVDWAVMDPPKPPAAASEPTPVPGSGVLPSRSRR